MVHQFSSCVELSHGGRFCANFVSGILSTVKQVTFIIHTIDFALI